jgi:hypothetical protein
MNILKLAEKRVPEHLLIKFETFFNATLSGVRLYESILPALFNAAAFTYGETIIFKPGRFDTTSIEGLSLLGHEFTHVLQQRHGKLSLMGNIATNYNEMEMEADDLGNLAAMYSQGNSLKPIRVRQQHIGKPVCFIQCKIDGFENAEAVKKKMEEDENINGYSISSQVVEDVIKTCLNMKEQVSYDQLIEKVKTAIARSTKIISSFYLNRKARQHAYQTDLIEDTTLSEIRKAEIEKISNTCFLSETYGLQTSMEMSEGFDLIKDVRDGLRSRNIYSATYMRSTLANDNKLVELICTKDVNMNIKREEMLKQFQDYRNKRDKNNERTKAYFCYVGSQAVINQLLEICKRKNYECKSEKFADGLYCFVASGNLVSLLNIDNILNYPINSKLGGTVSPYHLLKISSPYKPVTHADIDNSAFIKNFKLKFSRFYDTEPFKSLGLGKIFQGLLTLVDQQTEANKELREDVIIHKSLEYLYTIVTNLCKFSESRSYRATADLIEQFYGELFSILAIIQPYSFKDFEEAVIAIYKKRIPSLDQLKIEVNLHSSGMGALTSCIFAASEKFNRDYQLIIRHEYDIYLEFFHVVKKLFSGNKHAKNVIYVDTLNNSSDLEGIKTNVKSILSTLQIQISKTTDHIIFILDITIELNDNALEMLIKELYAYIDQGKLTVFLAKSFQKYASCGASRLMSGGSLVISSANEQTDYWHSYRSNDEYIQFPEKQLLIHLLKHAPDAELNLITRATENLLEVINTFVRNPQNSLPFYFPKVEAMFEQFKKFGLLKRDSFGFLTSCWSDFGDHARINPGQEPVSRLYEMLSYVLLVDPSLRRDRKTQININQQPRDLFNEIKEKFKNVKDYSDNITASCLYYIGDQLGAAEIDLVECMIYPRDKDHVLSPEMNAYLSRLWLKLRLKSPNLIAQSDKLKKAFENIDTKTQKDITDFIAALKSIKQLAIPYSSVKNLKKDKKYFPDHPVFDEFVVQLELCSKGPFKKWSESCSQAYRNALINKKINASIPIAMEEFSKVCQDCLKKEDVKNYLNALPHSHSVSLFLNTDLFINDIIGQLCMCTEFEPDLEYLFRHLFAGMSNSTLRYVCEQSIADKQFSRADFLMKLIERKLSKCSLSASALAQIETRCINLSKKCKGIAKAVLEIQDKIFNSQTELLLAFGIALKTNQPKIFQLITDPKTKNTLISTAYKEIIVQEISFERVEFYVSERVIKALEDREHIIEPTGVSEKCKTLLGQTFANRTLFENALQRIGISPDQNAPVMAIAATKQVVDRGLLADDIITSVYLTNTENINIRLDEVKIELQNAREGHGTANFMAIKTADAELRYSIIKCNNAASF